jgi:hypothetical protein
MSDCERLSGSTESRLTNASPRKFSLVARRSAEPVSALILYPTKND